MKKNSLLDRITRRDVIHAFAADDFALACEGDLGGLDERIRSFMQTQNTAIARQVLAGKNIQIECRSDYDQCKEIQFIVDVRESDADYRKRLEKLKHKTEDIIEAKQDLAEIQAQLNKLS